LTRNARNHLAPSQAAERQHKDQGAALTADLGNGIPGGRISQQMHLLGS
jgi:hypothetical protein